MDMASGVEVGQWAQCHLCVRIAFRKIFDLMGFATILSNVLLVPNRM